MSGSRKRRPLRLVLTCEHADYRIPRAYASLFARDEEVVRSHRGWDPGALPIARRMARGLAQPLLVTRWCRLLVEANRSPTNPRIWSRYTKGLPSEVRAEILARYWRPHREEVERAVAAAVAVGERVVHVAVHSFTPAMDGIVRNADVGLLFDSRRKHESAFARRWAESLRADDPALRVRLN
jgi:predicted N-formylglutamate amidohydrolase